jgi:hypothetical protein
MLGSPLPPPPPEKPKTFRDDLVGQFEGLSNFGSMNRPRDRTKFFWFERPEQGATHSSLQCEDYRATRVWEDEMGFGFKAGPGFRVKFHCILAQQICQRL